MKSNKIPCSNVSTESYTGKEQSPKRFGLSAEGFDINFEKEGFDNQIWSVQIKNSRKVWAKKCNISKITHEIPLLTPNHSNTLVDIKDDKNNNDIKPDDIDDDAKTEDDDKEVKESSSIKKDDKIEKKKTDYNIFIKFYLDKLKSENKDNTSNGELFKATTDEWRRLKKNPDELKILMESIKNK
jgi:hypothetical protein